ncbi:MAG: flagellar protein MotX [Chloroflexi bacterium]|nr:flagellar protein MotX [Chloroflexota bacterium]|tara:strand:+ start:10551 stop:11171 length:621 start_codon:yes stop_codon:yes gene_type:complete
MNLNKNKTKLLIGIATISGFLFPSFAINQSFELTPVPIYTENELISWINKDSHLKRLETDDCQIVEDIVARATRIDLPSYQFLYGDMLINSVCVEQNIETGLFYIRESAKQGFNPALYKLAQFYSKPIYVQKNDQRAIALLEEASFTGHVDSSILWAELLLEERGSPIDYPKVLKDLKESFSQKDKHHKIKELIEKIKFKIPENKH